jgi:hypothetical protein
VVDRGCAYPQVIGLTVLAEGVAGMLRLALESAPKPSQIVVVRSNNVPSNRFFKLIQAPPAPAPFRCTEVRFRDGREADYRHGAYEM